MTGGLVPLTYSAPAVSITLKIIESYGIDPEPLLRNLQIDPKLIQDPNARFNYTKIDQLWLDAVTLANDPCFGLRAARYWHPSQMGALGYAWLVSSSMQTALHRFSRYMSILTEGATLDIYETEEELSVHLNYKDISKQQPTRTDSFMAMLLAMCRANCGESFHPLSISLTHAEPEDSSEFYALFECSIHFDALENRFNLSKKLAEQHLISSNPRLAQLNDQVIIETLAKLDKSHVVEQVKVEILNQLPSGNVTDASVAEALYMSQRSFQRKLNKEGVTFKRLLNELRSELAIKYMQDSHLSLLEVAFMLGFGEYSSFSRAFKRWTGVSPSVFRSK
ncbi:MAG: helix-turn-helix domain-containing protein [Methyloprofundus sp.]|nr:helix-turn-helix domain-containing protein [Methyloprofundus sp.]